MKLIKKAYKAIMKVIRPDKDPVMEACDNIYGNQNFQQLVKDLDLELVDVELMNNKSNPDNKN